MSSNSYLLNTDSLVYTAESAMRLFKFGGRRLISELIWIESLNTKKQHKS